MKFKLGVLGGCIVAIGLAAGCGGDATETEASPATTASAPATSGAVPFERAFIDGMVPHHEEAIEMAQAAQEAGLTQPELIAIADSIISSQQNEIDQMLEWRADWFGSIELDPAGAEILGLSPAQMGMQHDASDLRSAEDVDQAFASIMIDHHAGAILMAELALERAGHAEITELARDVIGAQQREIEVMREHAEGRHG